MTEPPALPLEPEHNNGSAGKIVGTGVIDNRYGKLLGGTFTLTFTGRITHHNYTSGVTSALTGTMTETIHIPASAGVVFERN